MNKNYIGIGMIILGILLGVYVGVWVCFIGGIMGLVDVINQHALTKTFDGWKIAIGICKIVFGGTIGGLSSLLLILPGVSILMKH